jgi:hypothetical protein
VTYSIYSGGGSTFDLSTLEEKRYLTFRGVRYMMIAMDILFVILLLLTARVSRIGPVVFGCALIFTLWLTSWVTQRGPTGLSFDDRGAVLHYRHGGTKRLLWSDPRSIVILHDVRAWARSLSQPAYFAGWAAKPSAWWYTPLTVEALEA